MFFQGGTSRRKLFVRLQSSEAFCCFLHSRRGPAQRHRGRSPSLHVAANTTHGAHDVLHDVGACERPTKFFRQAKPRDGEDFVEALQNARRYARRVVFQPSREVADQLLGLVGVVQLPSLAQHPADGRVHWLGQPLHDVASLVNLAPLNQRLTPEAPPDRFRERLRPVDDEQPRHRRIEPARDEIVDQGLHHGGVLGRAFNEPERMLHAFAVDADRRHQHQLAGHVDAVDLHHQEVELGQVRGHPLLHACGRERDEVARGRRLRYSAPRRRWNVPLGQSYRTPKLARRHVDQHQVHRPLAEPVFVDRLLPACQRQFFPVEPAYPRPLDCDLASVEADLARRAPPAMTAPVLAARMPSPTGHLGVRFHHRAQRLDPGRQAEPIERRRHFFPGLTHRRPRNRTRHHGRCFHGVAFLSWIRHPEPTGSRRATPLHLFQHRPGHPLVSLADPVDTGIVPSLAHPGGNTTGFMNPEPAMSGKWLELLKDVAPSLNRVLVLVNAGNVGNAARLRVIEAAAPSLGVRVSSSAIRGPGDIESAINGVVGESNVGLIAAPAAPINDLRKLIFGLTTRHRLPAVYAYRYYAVDGGLMSYGVEPAAMWAQAGTYVDRILRGEKPADLPVQTPTKFQLVINLKTAKTMGLTIPESLLLR